MRKESLQRKGKPERKGSVQGKTARKKEAGKKFPSIGEVQALADKLGKHYGEVSQMLATGELTYER